MLSMMPLEDSAGSTVAIHGISLNLLLIDPCGEEWQGISCVTVCSEKNVSVSGVNVSVSGESNKTSCENVVGQLEFNNMKLAETLPDEIGNFPFMTVFIILATNDKTSLYDTLPASIGNLTSY